MSERNVLAKLEEMDERLHAFDAKLEAIIDALAELRPLPTPVEGTAPFAEG